MRNLFSFLFKNYFFFLFLFLEIIATVLIVNNNYYQRSIVLNATNEFTGSVMSAFSNITDYFSLKKLDELPPLSELMDIEKINPELDFGIEVVNSK